MQTVNHKNHGVGEVINKETKGNSTYITVRFKSGLESRYCIPDSFTIGILTAEGSLKDEVDEAIAEINLRNQEGFTKIPSTAVVPTTTSTGRRTKKSPKPVAIKGPVEEAYEAFLIKAGYETETPSGAPSTVYSYSGAIARHVLQEEHISWETLKNDIGTVIKKYEVGGIKEHIGARSNSTVLNALRRFEEFVNLA